MFFLKKLLYVVPHVGWISANVAVLPVPRQRDILVSYIQRNVFKLFPLVPRHLRGSRFSVMMICLSVRRLVTRFLPPNSSQQVRLNKDASNICENERIYSNIAFFVNGLRTDRPTDGPTDPRTDKASYRDAWTHLKMTKNHWKKTI